MCMAATDKTSVKNILVTLQATFKQQLPVKIQKIEVLWNVISHDDAIEDNLKELHMLVHSLAGSGGTFGAIAVSFEAKELEQLFKTLQANGDKSASLSQEIQQQGNDAILKLKQAANNWEPSNIPYIQPSDPKVQSNSNLIFLAEDDELLASNMIDKLKQANYTVRHFVELIDFEKAFEKELPAAVIMDIVFKEGDVAGADVICRVKEKINNFPPVVFISVRNDIEVRLAAARTGACRYFHKPLDMKKLVQTLDGLTAQVALEPFRVLLIDDDEDLLEYYGTVLREAGLDVQTLSEPLGGLHALIDYKPDVIVLDVYMPKCSGPELAQVIRQDDVWLQTPIMFLSTETDLNHQLSAMMLGGDDFLVKPVDANHLAAAVVARAKRARWARQLNSDLLNTLRESEFQVVTMDQHAIVSVTDITGKIIRVNDKFCEISGYTRSELVGKNHRMLKSGRHSIEFYNDMWSAISHGKVWSGTICNHNKNGGEYWVEATIVPFLDEKGKPYKYVSARTDITKRKRAEQSLIEAREDAEKANHAKSQFLSSMSHELRTPMNAIMGFGQLLKMDVENPLGKIQEESVDEITKAADHLLELINEILDLAKIESGRLSLSLETINLCELVAESVQLIMPMASKRGIDIVLSFNGEEIIFSKLLDHHITIWADRIRFKQVLLNLLSNAVKYNRENGQVKIECNEVDNNRIRISVIDQGVGLSDKEQSQLFKAFNRISAEQSNIEGTGIGLVITKNIIELMDGSIGVLSKKGEGSTFWVEISNETIEAGKSQKIGKINRSQVELGANSEKYYSVLYIEDNPANLRLVQQILASRKNIRVWSAGEPKLGLELAIEHNPDLILMDINLPGMTGFEVLSKLRQNDTTCLTPVIAISANAMSRDIEKGLQAGFDEYITKPVNVTALLDAVDLRLSSDFKG